MNHIPISEHNAKAWRLNEMDVSLKLKSPDQNGVLTVCDYSRAAKKLALLSMDVNGDGLGFTMTREDELPIQAQYVRPNRPFDPYGQNVFKNPVENVSVRKDDKSGLWHIERAVDEVDDRLGLGVLVWAMTKYSLDKKQKLVRQ